MGSLFVGTLWHRLWHSNFVPGSLTLFNSYCSLYTNKRTTSKGRLYSYTLYEEGVGG